jgi:tetratricopeptide (TPR) repeat protein
MNRIIKLSTTLFLLLFVVLLNASPVDSLKTANEFYAANEYEKAINTYESILAEGFESSALYFNLGNAYFKNGEIVMAILYFERANRLSPNDEDIQFNLEMANQFVVDKIEPLPRPFFIKWGKSIVNIYNADGWAIISLISFVLLLLFAAGYIFARTIAIKKTSFLLASLMLVITLTTYGFASAQRTIANTHNEAIIFNPTVTVKASPDESGTDLFVIHEGLKVTIVDELNDWIEVKLDDGNSGWVSKAVLERI